jgi:hypothetical protein
MLNVDSKSRKKTPGLLQVDTKHRRKSSFTPETPLTASVLKKGWRDPIPSMPPLPSSDIQIMVESPQSSQLEIKFPADTLDARKTKESPLHSPAGSIQFNMERRRRAETIQNQAQNGIGRRTDSINSNSSEARQKPRGISMSSKKAPILRLTSFRKERGKEAGPVSAYPGEFSTIPDNNYSTEDSNVSKYVEDLTPADIKKLYFELFSKSTRDEKISILCEILYECGPKELEFLNERIPRLHRNFLSKLDKKIVYRILQYLPPSCYVTVAGVCRDWNELICARDTWYNLYGSIGLGSMAPVFYIPNGSPKQNSYRFTAYGNWANGIFSGSEFQAHSLGILCLNFDGKYVVTGSSDRSCKVFLLKTAECLRTFRGHDDGINAVEFDDIKVVTGSSDKTIKVWSNQGTGSLLTTLCNHTGAVTVIII